MSGAPSTAYAVATGRPVLEAARAAGALLGRRSLGRGAAAHLAISFWWTLVFDRAGVRGAGRGAMAGAAVAALDLGVIGRRIPAIAALPPVPQLADHLLFGAVVGALLRRSE